MLPDARTRARDYFWAVVAVLMSALLLRQLAVTAIALIRTPTGKQLLTFVVVVALSLVTGWWLVGGAWRRTVWGAPPGGVREHREHRIAARANEHPTDEP